MTPNPPVEISLEEHMYLFQVSLFQALSKVPLSQILALEHDLAISAEDMPAPNAEPGLRVRQLLDWFKEETNNIFLSEFWETLEQATGISLATLR
ncbi:MAG: hypothetical protein ACFB0C_18690 [Leptolyngbyaceae cyanobacterium]